MTQLVCNGERLDLYENTSLQFTEENPLFAFDKIKCERTTSFKLPATPTNDRVFALARIPAYAGEGMRRKFAAQLQADSMVKDGYLYVSSFDGKDYSAVLVCGELVGLQAIKNLGKIADFMSFDETVMYLTSGELPSYGVNDLWGNVQYKHESEFLHPSISVKLLYEAILEAQSITGEALPASVENVRIIPAEVKALSQHDTTFTGTRHNMSSSGAYPVCYEIDLPDYFELITKSTAQVELHQLHSGQVDEVYTGAVEQFNTKAPLQLTFPSDWNDDLFIGYFNEEFSSNLLAQFTFLGDRSFNIYGTPSGDSLRGRTVDIPLNGKFVIIDKATWVNQDTSGGGHLEGWSPVDVLCNMRIQGAELVQNAYVRLQDNLPDVTFVELLKVIAALAGRVLNYSEADGITFDELNTTEWVKKENVRLVKRGQVQRVFADYAQHNLVRFDDENADRLQTDYTIQNVNLDEESDLVVIPFSEGRANGMFIYAYDGVDKDMLANADVSQLYLTRVALPKNSGLQLLCTASTQVEVQARMNAYEYAQITSKTKIVVRGTAYVWTSRSWQNDVAKFTLAKLP